MFDIGSPTLTPACQEYLATLKEMCGENVYAYIWLQQVVQVALIWDHIADGDKFEPKMFDLAMTALATEWPINPFLRKNADSLIPTVVASIAAWKYNESRDLHYSAYREIACCVAFILGGNPLVEKFMPRISAIVTKMKTEDDARDSKEVVKDE